MTPERPAPHLQVVQPLPEGTPRCEPPNGDPRALRTVFGRFATGITVVTSPGDAPHGMTANSFSSVSLDPPLVLVCVARDALMHETILANGAFGVSVLGAGQEQAARHFASRNRVPGLAQFAEVDWSTGPWTGAPLLAGALAWLECELTEVIEAGDHSIFLGRVLGLGNSPGEEALLFFGGAFHQVQTRDIA